MSLIHNLIFVLFSLVIVKCDTDVQTSFKEVKLVPHVIPKAPEKILKVTYGEKEVKLGTDLKVTETVAEPKVTWDADPDTLYTLVMFDADETVLSLTGQFLHWLEGNIKGNDLGTGDVIAPYVLDLPPPFTGSHRYTFLVYKQKDQDDFVELSTLARATFVISDFAEKHDLEGPFFGNFLLEKTV